MKKLVVLAVLLGLCVSAQAASYISNANGNWSAAGTWTTVPPAGGPQVGDTASIGAHAVTYDASAPGTVDAITFTSSTGGFTLGRDLTVTGNLTGSGSPKAISLASNTLTVDGTFQNGQTSVGAQPISRSAGGKLDINNLVWYRTSFTLDPADVVSNLTVDNANSATVVFTTAATGNVTDSVTLRRGGGGGSTTLSLGAPLDVSGNVQARESIIDDNGYDVTIDGNMSNNGPGGNNGGAAVRDGGVWDMGSLSMGRGVTWPLRPGDVVQTSIAGFKLGGFTTLVDFVVDQVSPYDLLTGLTLEGTGAGALSLSHNGATDKTEMYLNFDGATTGTAFDWAFRWKGDHVNALRDLYDPNYDLVLNPGRTQQLFVTSPVSFNLLTNIWLDVDGYTYVGYQASASAVPEPATMALLALGALGLVARRR